MTAIAFMDARIVAWSSTGNSGIIFAKSTDGGTTFTTSSDCSVTDDGWFL